MDNEQTQTYEDISSRLLMLSPLLACVNSKTNFTVARGHLEKLNDIYNNLILLILDELPINVIMPPLSRLPKLLNSVEFAKEYERLSIGVSDFNELYLALVHARKSHEENWKVKISIMIH